MRIQKITSSQSVPRQSSAGIIDPNAASRVGEGIASIGKAMTDIGQAYYLAQRKADMVATYHNSVTEMHKTLNDLDDELQNDPDYDGYEEKYRKRFNEKRDELLGVIQDPEAREKVSMAFDDMDLTASGAVQKLTWTRKASQYRADLGHDIDYWANQGDLDQVKTLIEDGKGAMLITPEEGEQLDRQKTHEIVIARARQDIMANPHKFVKNRYPELNQNDLISLQNEADAEVIRREARAERDLKKRQEETGSRALDLFYEGKLTPAWLKGQHKARNLDDGYFQSLMGALQKPGGGAQQTDLYTYAILKDQAAKGILTPAEVLKNAGKLTLSDAKGLIDDSMNKDIPSPEKIEKNYWREYIKKLVMPEDIKDMSPKKMREQDTIDALKLLAAYDRGVSSIEPGQVEQFAMYLAKPYQKKGFISSILEAMGSVDLSGIPSDGITLSPYQHKSEPGKNLPGKVEGVPDLIVEEIVSWLKENNKPVTEKNIQFIYKIKQGEK